MVGSRDDLANIKGVNKNAKIYNGKSMTMHSLFFFAHKLDMINVTEAFYRLFLQIEEQQLRYFLDGRGQNCKQKQNKELSATITISLFFSIKL